MDARVREYPASPVAAAQRSCLRKSGNYDSSRGWLAEIARAWRLIIADLPDGKAEGATVTPEEWGELEDRKVLFMDPRVKVSERMAYARVFSRTVGKGLTPDCLSQAPHACAADL